VRPKASGIRHQASARTLIVACALGACATSNTPPDVGLAALALTRVAPDTIVPATQIQIVGASFVDETWGASAIRFTATPGGGGGPDFALAATFVDDTHLVAAVDPKWIQQRGGDFDFAGDATVEVLSAVDGQLYTSTPLPVSLHFRQTLTPTATAAPSGVVFVNDAIALTGGGLLLGGAEGQTVATVTGCFTPDGSSTCAPVAAQTIAVTPDDPLARDRGSFPFAPSIAGIAPGTFTGQIVLENRHAGGVRTHGDSQARSFTLTLPAIFHIDPGAASLGQYVFVGGGGFVGKTPGDADAATELHLVGQFARTGAPAAAPVDLLLIPEVVSGRVARYVISTSDAIGQALDLRTDTGTFTGTVTPIVSWHGAEVTGTSAPFTLAIAPVRQVVYLQFTTSYVESLRLFGLRAVDRDLRDRILAVVRAAYPAINIDFRTEPPADFALFSTVEITGPDPNGMGLFGYDNSPGKDVDNLRLYDQLGGVNAQTQEDGSPGYGGVFVESLMGFSRHPAIGAGLDGVDPTFDQIFDPLRPDGGDPVRADDLADGLLTVDAADCPSGDRATRIACAVRTLGSLLGGTIAHEVGHSLGLANPYGDGYHDPGDAADRLMDAGGDRPFLERAELGGQGPGRFCDDEYQYLRTILPTSAAADPSPRPSCN
jgi:hypothetical protein